ncbi:Uncharacterised protein [Klebsiella michiganensis]|nr:Uncharacterised protein [Klebsiella michiganensis]
MNAVELIVSDTVTGIIVLPLYSKPFIRIKINAVFSITVDVVALQNASVTGVSRAVCSRRTFKPIFIETQVITDRDEAIYTAVGHPRMVVLTHIPDSNSVASHTDATLWLEKYTVIFIALIHGLTDINRFTGKVPGSQTNA